MAPEKEPTPRSSLTATEHAHDFEKSSRERMSSPNRETEANIYPEPEATAEADVAEMDLEKAPVKPHPGADFPDGGTAAWLCVLGSFFCLFCSFGWINAIGIFQEYYSRNQLRDYSDSTVAWIPSLEVFMMFIGGPIFGKVFDNYGPRYLLLFGSLAHVFGLMMTSLSSQYYQFILAQGICSALGASAIFYAGMSSVSTWFFKKRATAIGIVASGSSLGGVIFPILVTKLIPEVGFPWAMRTAAFLILGLMIIANLTVKSRLPPNPRPIVLMEFVRPVGELPFALVTAASFLTFLGLFIPFTFVILQGQSVGMSVDLSNYLIPILNAVSIFGRILPGILADKVGRFNTMIVTSILSFILVLALWLPSRGAAPVIVFSALYGFSSGAFVSLAPALVAQISEIRQIGTRNGTLFAIVSIAALVGTPIGGALIARDGGDFLYVQIYAGVTMAAGAVLFVASRLVQTGVVLKKVV